MNIPPLLDPVLGGQIRAGINSVVAALLPLFAALGAMEEPWAQITLAVLGSLVLLIEGLSHRTSVGNVSINDDADVDGYVADQPSV